jgi:hypothetical protein
VHQRPDRGDDDGWQRVSRGRSRRRLVAEKRERGEPLLDERRVGEGALVEERVVLGQERDRRRARRVDLDLLGKLARPTRVGDDDEERALQRVLERREQVRFRGLERGEPSRRAVDGTSQPPDKRGEGRSGLDCSEQPRQVQDGPLWSSAAEVAGPEVADRNANTD